MDQLIELLQQIADLAGVGIDAIQQAAGGEGAPGPEAEAQPAGGPPSSPPEPGA